MKNGKKSFVERNSEPSMYVGRIEKNKAHRGLVPTAGFGWLGLPAAGYLGELGLGSDFGILFYGMLLVASCVLLVLINIAKLIIH